MRDLFPADEFPGAADNTLLVAERADLQIEFGRSLLPQFPVPEGRNEDSYLRELVYAGAAERYGDLMDDVRARIDFELGVITEMGFSAYFLIVWDLIRYARERGIRTGPGRGSAAGSIVAYCLRITNLDPIEFGLIFERFLNPGRRQMPDIDMDFDERYRGEVIRYCAERYGSDHVAQIITFSTIKGKQAIRDAATGPRPSLQPRRPGGQADASGDSRKRGHPCPGAREARPRSRICGSGPLHRGGRPPRDV